MTIRSKSFLLRAVVVVAVFSVVLVAFYGLGFRPFKASASSPVSPPQEEAASSSKISRSSVKPRPVTKTDAQFRRLLQALQREDDETARVRAEGNGSIRGTVSMGMETESAQDATVAVFPSFGATSEKSVILKSTKTDQQGNYVISGLALNTQYIVSAGAPGCTTSSRSYYLANSPDPCNFFLRKKGTGRIFNGTVVDATTSKPLEGTKIIAPQVVPVVSAITDKNGKFRLEDLDNQIYLEVHKDGYYLTEDSKSDPFILQYSFNKASDLQETDTVINMFPGAASISGRVVDETSRPLHTAAQICLSYSYIDESVGGSFTSLRDLHYWTNERGEFSINGLPPNRAFGLYAIRGTVGVPVEITLQPGEHKRDLELCVSSLVTVTGRTVDDATGQPVPGVRILYNCLLSHKEIQTGPDGEFSLLAEARYGLFDCIALADGWCFSGSKNRSPLVRIPVPKGAVKVDADIRMTAVPVIYGTVTGKPGPLPSTSVYAAFQTQQGMKQIKGYTDQKGEFSLNLPSIIQKDSHVLIFAGDSYAHGAVTLSKFNNNRTRVDLQIPENTTIDFAEFYMSDGKPLAETFSANYCYSFHSRSNGLRVDSPNLGISDKTGTCLMMQAQWDDVTIRLDLGEGKIVESPVNMQDLMKGPVLFIYDPVAEKITVSHEVAHAQLPGPPNKETGKPASDETKETK